MKGPAPLKENKAGLILRYTESGRFLPAIASEATQSRVADDALDRHGGKAASR
jgi:hypothetical protein